MKLGNSQTTPHSSPSQVSYGASYVIIFQEKLPNLYDDSLEIITAEYTTRNMQTFSTLLWYGKGRFHPYPSGLFHQHWGNHVITPVPVK